MNRSRLREKLPLYDAARRVYTAEVRRRRQAVDPRHNFDLHPDATAGPLVDVFDRIRVVPGWFNPDDVAHFSLVLATQSAAGITGDLLEIGSYHGRSAAVLAAHLMQGERLHVCDAFEAPVEDDYADPATPEALWDTIRRVNPQLARARVEIHAMYSTDLDFDRDQRFRFVHVDGGHGRDVALHDLRLARTHLLPGGIIAVDDYEHPAWPGVTEAVDDFLVEFPDIGVAADLNRRGAAGRKVYLAARPCARASASSTTSA
jgi:predicted O-methyltransferase YrrM